MESRKSHRPLTAKMAFSADPKYKPVFEKVPFQSALIFLNSHWDWYLRKLGDFIVFARDKLSAVPLSNPNAKRLERISYLSILKQLEVLEISADIQLSLSADNRSKLKEMALVRNLGLHNRWEADARYLANTPRKGLSAGDLRTIDLDELFMWQRLLITLVNDSATKVAVKFVSAPDYP